MMKEFNKRTLGKRIKQLRLSKSLTQDALCDKLNIDASMLSNFETGKTAPSLANLIKIINALEIEPNELFSYEHLVEEKDVDKEVLKLYNSLSLDKKQYFLRLLKFIFEM